MEANQDLERTILSQGRHPSILGDVWLVSEINVDQVIMIFGKIDLSLMIPPSGGGQWVQ